MRRITQTRPAALTKCPRSALAAVPDPQKREGRLPVVQRRRVEHHVRAFEPRALRLFLLPLLGAEACLALVGAGILEWRRGGVGTRVLAPLDGLDDPVIEEATSMCTTVVAVIYACEGEAVGRLFTGFGVVGHVVVAVRPVCNGGDVDAIADGVAAAASVEDEGLVRHGRFVCFGHFGGSNWTVDQWIEKAKTDGSLQPREVALDEELTRERNNRRVRRR